MVGYPTACIGGCPADCRTIRDIRSDVATHHTVTRRGFEQPTSSLKGMGSREAGGRPPRAFTDDHAAAACRSTRGSQAQRIVDSDPPAEHSRSPFRCCGRAFGSELATDGSHRAASVNRTPPHFRRSKLSTLRSYSSSPLPIIQYVRFRTRTALRSGLGGIAGAHSDHGKNQRCVAADVNSASMGVARWVRVDASQ